PGGLASPFEVEQAVVPGRRGRGDRRCTAARGDPGGAYGRSLRESILGRGLSILRYRLISFFVEFPSGPLGIGRDLRIRPVWRSRRAAKTIALSATDACRYRLAAFYFWNDLQSLAAAVAIAVRNRVAFAKVRAWSRSEGQAEGYIVFLTELSRRRAAHRPRKKYARTSPKR